MMRQLQKATSEYGYFKEQGIHNPSKLPYAYLMAIHEYGTRNGNIPARKPFSIALFEGQERLMKTTMNKLSKYIYSAASSARVSVGPTLTTFGSHGVYMTRNLFGSSKLLTNSQETIRKKGRSAPLLDSNDLRDSMAYRTSENNKVIT